MAAYSVLSALFAEAWVRIAPTLDGSATSVLTVGFLLTAVIGSGAMVLHSQRRRLVKMWGPLQPKRSLLAVAHLLAVFAVVLGAFTGWADQASALAWLSIVVGVCLTALAVRSGYWAAYVVLLVVAAYCSSVQLAPINEIATALAPPAALLALLGNHRLMWR